jgi:predicted permease
MFEQMPILISQMEIFASLIFIGFIIQKIGLLSDENISNFSTILSRFIIPSMLITMIPNGGTRAELLGGWKFLICAAASIAFMIVVGFILSGMLKFSDEARRRIHILAVSYGNAGFIGIPLMAAVFPETAAIPSALYLLCEAVACWVVGPALADPTPGKKSISLKKVVSPLTISIALGIVLVLLNINLQGFVLWDTLTNIGNTTKYFASLYVGLNLGRQGFKSIFGDKKIFLSTPFKLIVFPVLAYVVFGKTGILSGDRLIILILFLATPTGMAVPIIADMVNGDKAYATAGTLLNTLFCLVSIPLVMEIISLF